MRYFIGYLLDETTSKYCREVAVNLQARFGVKNTFETQLPHLTFKPPFELIEVDSLLAGLSNIATQCSAINFRFNRFNYFKHRNHGTFFLEPQDNPDFKGLVTWLTDELAEIGLSTNLPKPLHPHASIARDVPLSTFDKAWQYLDNLPRPDFEAKLNNLTIFVREPSRWQVFRRLELV